MQTFERLIDYCLSLPQAYLDYPFQDTTPVLKHQTNGKWFAFLFQREGKHFVNLKCHPATALMWRDIYQGITPGYHMNKKHWNSIELNSDVPNESLFLMIRDSHQLVSPKRPKT